MTTDFIPSQHPRNLDGKFATKANSEIEGGLDALSASISPETVAAGDLHALEAMSAELIQRIEKVRLSIIGKAVRTLHPKAAGFRAYQSDDDLRLVVEAVIDADGKDLTREVNTTSFNTAWTDFEVEVATLDPNGEWNSHATEVDSWTWEFRCDDNGEWNSHATKVDSWTWEFRCDDLDQIGQG